MRALAVFTATTAVVILRHSLLVPARLHQHHQHRDLQQATGNRPIYNGGSAGTTSTTTTTTTTTTTCDVLSFGDACHQTDPGGWCRCIGGVGSIAQNKGDTNCYDSFTDDCECLTGYQLTVDGCVFCNLDRKDAFCRDEGSDGAIPRDGQLCYDVFQDDCDCKKGYVMSDDRDTCEYCDHADRDRWCRDEGGEGAFAKQDENCNNDFDQHCECRDGYRKFEDKCEFCNLGNQDAWCQSFDRYGGGEGAVAKSGFSCYYDFEDHCDCSEGYLKRSEGCEKDCHERDYDAWCQSVGGPGSYGREDIGDCWDNFRQHCACFDGYELTETACVESSSRVDRDRVRYVGDNREPASAFPLGRCEGDCDRDRDCRGSLECFQRRSGYTPVPGCLGGDTDPSDHDYCYDPSALTQAREEPTNVTYTIYKFTQSEASPVEAGCSYAQAAVVAACKDGAISMVDTSLTSISCGVATRHADGSSRIQCNNTCVGSVCEGVLLITSRLGDSSLGQFDLGEVKFSCERGTKTSEFVCGANGIKTVASPTAAQTDDITLHNVDEKKDFRWGLFHGNYHCLESFSSVSFSLGRSGSTAGNPDLALP